MAHEYYGKAKADVKKRGDVRQYMRDNGKIPEPAFVIFDWHPMNRSLPKRKRQRKRRKG